MTLPAWIFPPARAQIQRFCQAIQSYLADNLVGIYLHGSVAMKCFNPRHSDLDLLVVNQQQMSVERKRHITDLLLRLSNAPYPIEISFLILSDIWPFEHPLPFDLHYSEMWRQQKSKEMADGAWQEWNKEKRHDPDLAAHLTIVQHRGLVLYGKPISEVFPPVPRADYLHSLDGDYRDARENRREKPIYFILNACRVHAFLTTGKIFSKDEGGVYALEALPALFHALIRQALDVYRGMRPATSFEENSLETFAAFMDQALLK